MIHPPYCLCLFLLLTGSYSIVWMSHNLFIHINNNIRLIQYVISMIFTKGRFSRHPAGGIQMNESWEKKLSYMFTTVYNIPENWIEGENTFFFSICLYSIPLYWAKEPFYWLHVETALGVHPVCRSSLNCHWYFFLGFKCFPGRLINPTAVFLWWVSVNLSVVSNSLQPHRL